jgi:hypothetical protein
MLRRMSAEILFLNPNDVSSGCAELIERDFAVEALDGDDWIDECGPTVFVRARIITDIGEDHFLDWVQAIVEPLGGDVMEAGLEAQSYRREVSNWMRH